MTFFHENDIFMGDNYSILPHNMSKLFTTFTKEENLEETLKEIQRRYTILHNKIFVLQVEGKDELICTYNVDTFNISDKIMPNTILLHRKKESNTLYSINSLNALVKELNLGKTDTHFPIDWQSYKNTILLVSDGVLNKHTTKIFQIINLAS